VAVTVKINLRMEKFKIDYSETSHFKGIRILFEYLEEGIKYAFDNHIVDVCVWSNGNWEKKDVDFDFLKSLPFLKTFHWIVPLTKKSNIIGLYNLENLENLRWSVDNDFAIDFSNLVSIEKLNLSYSSLLTHWESLKLLKELYIQSVKTEDCSFLSDLKKLEKLRIINGNLTSLNGLEGCDNIKEVIIKKCPRLKNIDSIFKNKKLEKIQFEKCKNVVVNLEELKSHVKHVSIIK